jgi:DNA replication and repair protein RecF
MTIRHLSLENFRNYKRGDFSFSPACNLIIGPNTVGKTNLLEAASLVAFGGSPRATLDREMIREGAAHAFVLANVEGSDPRELEVQLVAHASSNLTGKRFKVNGVKKRLSDFLPHFYAVLFLPEDLNLVVGSPDLRRRFLDTALSNVSTRYRRSVIEYHKVRRHRNRLLERVNGGGAQDEEIAFWDAKLLEFGTFIQEARKKFFEELNELFQSSGFSLQYLVSGLTAERLRDFRERELAAQTTLIGPHRDDFSFSLGGRDLAAYGSRSEQRRAVLALKKAELEFVGRSVAERPILLLDDIFSELDEDNRQRVSSFLGESQVILTAADLGNIPPAFKKNLKMISL